MERDRGFGARVSFFVTYVEYIAAYQELLAWPEEAFAEPGGLRRARRLHILWVHLQGYAIEAGVPLPLRGWVQDNAGWWAPADIADIGPVIFPP